MSERPSLQRRLRDYWWLPLGVVVLCVLAVLFESTAIEGFSPGFTAVPLDDAWIHFVYADNALRTGVLHYNPGQPAAGTSSLLWVLALALPIRLGIYAPVAAKLLGLLTQLALATLVFATLRRLADRRLAVVGALLVCADPIGMFAGLSGMEVLPYAALAFGAAAALAAGRTTWAGYLAGLTVIARPDGALLAGVVIVCGLWHEASTARGRPAGTRQLGRTALSLIGPPLLFGLAWAYLNWRATGRFLPASFHVRAGGWSTFFDLPPLGEIFGNLAEAGSFVGQPLQWMLYALGLVWIAWRRDARLWVFVIFPWLVTLLLAGEKLQILGGTFLGHRYIVPALPFFLFVQLLGAAFVFELLLEKRVLHRTYRKRYLPALIALAALALLIGDPRLVVRHTNDLRHEFAAACRDIERMDVAVGRWLADNTPPGARVGTFDAGAAAFFSGRETVDILGLNTPYTPPLSPSVIARLDYLVTFPKLSQGVQEPYADREVFRVEIADPVAVASSPLVVYRIAAPPEP